jgi:A/G-specific adenine glycosylase
MTQPIATKKILRWYQQHGRKHLPWQKNRTAYRVWLSEIMLQQTQVQTVIPYYHRFLEKFPNVIELADAPLDEVLQLWAGLGYYTRARNLYKTAIIIRDKYQGKFPKNLADMIALPGIGRSTASAILAFSQKQALPILDGNVKRVLTRLHAIADFPGKPDVEKKLWALATHYTPDKENIIDYTQAIMDLGATICTRTKPKCDQCPIADECIAFAKNQMQLYPAKSPKKSLPIKKIFFIVCVNNKKEILLERRPEAGIWGGLWSFPESSSPALPASWQNLFHITHTEDSQELPPIQHTFSHYKLIATPIQYFVTKTTPLAMSDTHYLWHNPKNSLPKGVPAPIKKWLESR